MAPTNDQVLHVLRYLYRMIEAGERGYATAAINSKSPGIKLLFKSFAQQRAEFKQEILDEIRRLGGDDTPRSSFTGRIHRGRVAIFSAMIIEDDQRERVILKEVALGERYAVQAYQKALAANLPAETRGIVQRQFEAVREVIGQVHLLRGREGKRMVVQLFETEGDANAAISTLKHEGISLDGLKKIEVSESIDVYTGKGTTVPETMLSGAVGGIVWGSLIGILAGFGVAQTNPGWLGIGSIFAEWALIAVGIIIIAAMVGAVIGLFLGAGIADDDRYVYRQSAQEGRCLVTAVVVENQLNQARLILRTIDTESPRSAVRKLA